jgi:hypothetical protein
MRFTHRPCGGLLLPEARVRLTSELLPGKGFIILYLCTYGIYRSAIETVKAPKQLADPF